MEKFPQDPQKHIEQDQKDSGVFDKKTLDHRFLDDNLEERYGITEENFSQAKDIIISALQRGKGVQVSSSWDEGNMRGWQQSSAYANPEESTDALAKTRPTRMEQVEGRESTADYLTRVLSWGVSDDPNTAVIEIFKEEEKDSELE